ncbi:hypothetical protein [Azospirillum halopraeferens]|uniref:hypothetical protein n=1 Tax=Azospirillum halopraeferens TaxID=34010 RepID=UPI00048C0A2B|nr:hypothetical protein [Azospirillum halopraeferens]
MNGAHRRTQHYGWGLVPGLVVGLVVGIDVELVGRITGSELALLLLLPAAVVTGRLPPVTSPIRTLVLLALVWLAVQFISDLVNDSEIDNMARGAARAGATVLLVLGFFTLIGDRLRSIRTVFLALALGLLVSPLLNPSDYFEGDPWKFGYGGGVTMLVISAAGILWVMEQRSAAILLCLGAGGLNLLLGFRSLAGIAIMTALILLLSMVFGRRGRAFSPIQMGATLLVLMIGSLGVIEVYSHAAQTGLLGEWEREKFLAQVDERGVLLSGRAEFPVAFEAVREKPLLGHGSWAANEHYAILLLELSGVSLDNIPVDVPDLIPTHSHLMGAWVEGGILAALFWFYVVAILVRAIFSTVHNIRLADPVIIFSLLNLAWAILFSPYGLTNRVLSCFAIVIAATVLRLDTGRDAGGGIGR